MAILYLLIFTLTYYFFGVIVVEKFFKKYFKAKDYFFIAPAIALTILSLFSVIVYIVNAEWLIPVFFAGMLSLIAFKFKLIIAHLKSLNWFHYFTLAVFILVLVLQNVLFIVGVDKAENRRVPGNTWQIFAISGGVSPPDQTFQWHQARFFKYRLLGWKETKEKLYHDVDFFERPSLGGFLTYFFLYGQDISKDDFPDLNYHSDAVFKIYKQIWWSLNNLYILGIAYLMAYLFKRRLACLAVGLVAVSHFTVLLSTGIWPKLLAFYLFSVLLVWHLRKILPWVQGFLMAVVFYIHPSFLPFLMALNFENGINFLAVLFRRRQQNQQLKKQQPKGPRKIILARFSYMFKVALIPLILIPGWFLLTKIYQAPQSLRLTYSYNISWDKLDQEIDKEKVKQEFYANTATANLILLPVFNISKNLIPISLIEYINGFTLADEEYLDFGDFMDSISLVEIDRFPGVLGIYALPLIFLGFLIMLKDRQARKLWLYLYLVPIFIVAIAYRKDDIIKNSIASAYLIIAIIAVIYWVKEKIRKRIWLAVLIGFAILDNFLSVLFAKDHFNDDCVRLGLAYEAKHDFDWQWLYYLAVLILIGFLSFRFSKAGFKKIEE